MADLGAWALLPPAVAIGAAVSTRRVFQSLLLGMGVAGFQVAWTEAEGTSRLGAALLGVFMEPIEWIIEGIAVPGNAAIFTFVLLLGALVAVFHRTGAIRAFGEAAMRYAGTRRRLQVLAWATGATVLAIDDHFNVIASGTMFRPVTDRLRISREKLAYIIDSTGAPVAILNPVSTWAGFMVAFAATALAAQGIDRSGFTTFLQSIPYNFYAWATLAFVLIVAASGRDWGPMARAEARADAGAVLRPGSRPLMSQNITADPDADAGGRVRDLVLPLAFLFAATLSMLYATGHAPGLSLRQSIAAADAPLSLAVATALTVGMAWTMSRAQGLLDEDTFMDTLLDGLKAMMPAMAILALAFGLGNAVADVGLGAWLAEAVAGDFPARALPLLAFLVSAGMAFATGTSFGTYAIMIPITFQVTAAYPDADVWFGPVLAAVSGGGVFGDHCSPISDTTVLSSMAAQCDHIDHVRTQLPYAMLTAGLASVGYGALALGAPLWIALPAALVPLALLALRWAPLPGRGGVPDEQA